MNRKELKKIKNYEISDELGNKIKKVIKRVKWYQWATMTFTKLEKKLLNKLTYQEKEEWNNIPEGVKDFILVGDKPTNGGKQNV